MGNAIMLNGGQSAQIKYATGTLVLTADSTRPVLYHNLDCDTVLFYIYPKGGNIEVPTGTEHITTSFAGVSCTEYKTVNAHGIIDGTEKDYSYTLAPVSHVAHRWLNGSDNQNNGNLTSVSRNAFTAVLSYTMMAGEYTWEAYGFNMVSMNGEI